MIFKLSYVLHVLEATPKSKYLLNTKRRYHEMLLKVLKDSFFKVKAIAAAELNDTEKLAVKAEATFEISAWKLGTDNHVKFTLDKPAAEFKNNTYFIYSEHCQVIADDKSIDWDGANLAANRKKSSIDAKVYKVGDKLPESVNLDVPFLSQVNNRFRPGGTCNITCVAMVLDYFNLENKLPRDQRQLEDDIFELVEAHGWDRHVHDHLAKVFKMYGVKDTFDTNTTWGAVKTSLANGNPVIYSGQFTRGGHIVVLKGYDESEKCWWVNDPWGEYYASGYKKNSENESPGKNVKYSYKLLADLSYSGRDETWAHLVQKPD